MGKKLSSEKLFDKKFTAAFFDQLINPYELTHKIEDNLNNNDPTNGEDNASFKGEEIDLAHKSGDNDEDYGQKEENEDFVDDSMDTSKLNQEEHDHKDSNNEDKELTRKAQ